MVATPKIVVGRSVRRHWFCDGATGVVTVASEKKALAVTVAAGEEERLTVPKGKLLVLTKDCWLLLPIVAVAGEERERGRGSFCCCCCHQSWGR